MNNYRIFGVIKGYHAYKVKPIVGASFKCLAEPDNPYDDKAVAVKDGSTVIGHVPARPIRLNHCLLDIVDRWPGFPIKW